MQDRKDEKSTLPVTLSVYNNHLGAAAYAAPPPPVTSEHQKEKEAKEEKFFESLYGNEKRATRFPKSPEMVAVKLPEEFKTPEALKEKIKTLKSSQDAKDELAKLETLQAQIEMNQAFQQQFDKLIGALTAWSFDADDVKKKKAAENLEYFRTHLFTDSFAGNQDSIYFEELKILLERFYLYYLLNDTIPAHVKAKSFNALLPELIVCGPGAHAHLQESMNVEAGTFSLEHAITKARTLLIQKLASKYAMAARTNVIRPLRAGDEIHVNVSFARLAKQLGLNPEHEPAKDVAHIHTHLDEKVTNDFFTNPNNRYRKEFERNFQNEFNETWITDFVFDNVMLALWEEVKAEIAIYNKATDAQNKKRADEFKQGQRTQLDLIPEAKIESEYWPVNFANVMSIVKKTLLAAGIELSEDFLEYKEPAEKNQAPTHARFKKDMLRDALMKGLMNKGVFEKGIVHQGKIYFYKDYLPPSKHLMDFVQRLQKGDARDFEKLRDDKMLPMQVKDTLRLRLMDMQTKGTKLLKKHIQLKKAIFATPADVALIQRLLDTPGIDLNYKLDNEATLWEYASKADRFHALKLFLDTKKIAQQTIDADFRGYFAKERFDHCQFLLEKQAVSNSAKTLIANMAIKSRNLAGCTFLFTAGVITKEQLISVQKAEEKKEDKTTASTPAFFKSPPSAPKELEKDLQQLLEHVVDGNPTEVANMLKANPQLLLHKGRADEYSGRPLEGTAYQIALAVDDTQMAALIRTHLIKTADEKTADAQRLEQLPDQWEKEEEKSWAPIFKQLTTLAAVIHAHPTDISTDKSRAVSIKEKSPIETALILFRSQLDNILKNPPRTGRVFNQDLLLQALKTWGELCKKYSASDNRRLCFWQQVIGYIHRIMPINYMQAACDTFKKTAKKLAANEEQGRALSLELQSGTNNLVITNVYSEEGGAFSALGLRVAIANHNTASAVSLVSDLAPMFELDNYQTYLNAKELSRKPQAAPRHTS